MLALLNQNYSVMKYLIDEGADVNMTDTHMAGKNIKLMLNYLDCIEVV